MDFGCSSFTWRTEDGRHLLGRTYDQFGDLTANRVISVPQGMPCVPGLHGEGAASGEYSYTGMAVLGFGEPILVDGVNSAGLMGALLHFPEYAVYEESAGPSRTAVHPGRLLAWLFSRCASVEETVEALKLSPPGPPRQAAGLLLGSDALVRGPEGLRAPGLCRGAGRSDCPGGPERQREKQPFQAAAGAEHPA